MTVGRDRQSASDEANDGVNVKPRFCLTCMNVPFILFNDFLNSVEFLEG